MHCIDGVWVPDNPNIDKDIYKWVRQLEKLNNVWPLIKSWEWCIDIGGSLGLYANEFCKRFKRVDSFEPLGVNVECMLLNCGGTCNLNVHEEAVGNINGPKLFRINKAGMAKGKDKKGEEITCNVVTLDGYKYFSDMGLGFLKIDAEGMDLEVLQGGEKLIMEYKPTIMIEHKFQEEVLKFWLKERMYKLAWNDHVDSVWTYD